MGEVNFLDVSKRFSLRVDGEVHYVQALDRVSFSVRDGEIVALIGPSGWMPRAAAESPWMGAKSMVAATIAAWCSSTPNCCRGSLRGRT